MKKKLNIILSITLVLGILLSSYGTYCLAFMNSNKTPTTESTGPAPGGGGQPGQPEEPPSSGDSPNEMTLADDVKVFSKEEAENINDAIISIECQNGSFSDNGRLEIVLAGNKEELFGDMTYGDVFLLDGNKSTPLMQPYLLKVDNIYQSGEEAVLTVRQPEVAEVFESVDISFADALTEKNLVSSTTVPGVNAYFAGSKTTGATNSNDKYPVQTLSTSSASQPEMTTIAEDYSVTAGDFVIELNVDLGEEGEDDDEYEFETDRMEGEIEAGFSLNGKIEVKDLTAHMVFDMTSPLEINELYFGLSGETYTSTGIHGNIEGTFSPKATEKEFKFLDASLSGLNEKAIPLGIWHFTGTTLIKVPTSVHEEIRVAPSIFLMLYSDIEGNISFDFGMDLKHSYSFNSGLRVFKEGKPWMQPETYPYQTLGNETAPEDDFYWEVNLQLDANLDFTIFGSSASFFIAGINIGEIAIFELGAEANCNLGVTGNKKDGVKYSDDNSAYIRMYLKLLELRARFVGEVEVFKREIDFGGEMEMCLIDLTLFKKGETPDKYKKTPVSTMSIPNEFDSAMIIVGDVSGSMNSTVGTGETKLQAARQAGVIVTNMVRDWSERYEGVFGIGVIQFASAPKVLAVPHIDYDFIADSIEIMGDGGGTDIESGINSAISQLDTTNAKDKTIILMTDGEDGNYSGIVAKAKEAKEKGIKIYTIGFGNGVNTELLTEVADTTGGEYRFADTSNMVGIISGFMYAYESSHSEVLSDFEGTVSEGETVKAGTCEVPDRSGDLNVNLYWPGSFLDLILVDPNSREVDENYPGATIDESKIPSTVTIKDPLPGEWEIKVKGVETSYENEPYYAITSFKDVEKKQISEKLETSVIIGAYCIPLGAFVMLTSIMFLVLVNAKKKKETEEE